MADSRQPPRTSVLGHSQSSLTGLLALLFSTQDYVLGYSQPSPFDKLRAGSTGLIAICPIADLFLTTTIRIGRAEKLIWQRCPKPDGR